MRSKRRMRCHMPQKLLIRQPLAATRRLRDYSSTAKGGPLDVCKTTHPPPKEVPSTFAKQTRRSLATSSHRKGRLLNSLRSEIESLLQREKVDFAKQKTDEVLYASETTHTTPPPFRIRSTNLHKKIKKKRENLCAIHEMFINI